MTEDPVRDLLLLRDQFSTLRNALAINDLASVEAATDALRASLTQISSAPEFPREAQDILREVTSLSGDVADTLASRINAFDLVIEALKTQEGPSG